MSEVTHDQLVTQFTTARRRPSFIINSLAFNNTVLCTWSTFGYAWVGRRLFSKPWNTLPSTATPGYQLWWNHQTAGTGPCKDRQRLLPPHEFCKYRANNRSLYSQVFSKSKYLLIACARKSVSANFDCGFVVVVVLRLPHLLVVKHANPFIDFNLC